jgi:hypothetical protein
MLLLVFGISLYKFFGCNFQADRDATPYRYANAKLPILFKNKDQYKSKENKEMMRDGNLVE